VTTWLASRRRRAVCGQTPRRRSARAVARMRNTVGQIPAQTGRPERGACDAAPPPAVRVAPGVAQERQCLAAHRQRRDTKRDVDVLVTPPAPTRISRSTNCGIDKRIASPRRRRANADDGHLVDVEDGQQVAHAVGVGGDGVIGPRLVGLAVAQQIGAMTVNRCANLLCTVLTWWSCRDAVDQQDRRPEPAPGTHAGTRGWCGSAAMESVPARCAG